MKKTLAILAALTVFVGALVGCAKKAAEEQPTTTLPHQGETAKAEDGSVYAVGETVTAENGETQIAQPITTPDGTLVGVTLMTPEQISSRQVMEELEASYSGRTNRERITTTAVRGTSPNRLTTRPTLPETEPRSVKLPETLSPSSAPEITVAPERIKVSYPDSLTFTENGKTFGYKIDKYEISSADKGAVVTLTIHPLDALSEAAIMKIGYSCFDTADKKLNEKPLYAPAVLNPSGDATQAVIPLPAGTARVEFFGS